MQVGDLVSWENAGGEYELGVVVELDEPNPKREVMVYFFQDNAVSCMTMIDLEVINESR